jgi:hypothetical protein
MSAVTLHNFDEPGSGNYAHHASEVEGWIIDQLQPLIAGQDGGHDQISIEPFRGLLKVHTQDGLFFFKAVRDIFKHEQKLTCLLAGLCPANLPDVVGAHDEKGWLLMRAIDGIPLDDLYETRYFEEAIHSFARIQVDCIEHATALLASGCQDYRLESLTLNIESLFEDILAWETYNEETERIREHIDFPILIERLRERSELMERENIPPTLGHGDLHLGNVFTENDRYVFIDWAEGYVGPPFFTLLEYFGGVKRDRGIEMANIPALRAAYLKPWSEILRVDAFYLVKLIELSRPLGMLRIVIRLGECYANVEEIRKDRATTIAYMKRIWTLIQRMDRVLGRGGV